MTAFCVTPQEISGDFDIVTDTIRAAVYSKKTVNEDTHVFRVVSDARAYPVSHTKPEPHRARIPSCFISGSFFKPLLPDHALETNTLST